MKDGCHRTKLSVYQAYELQLYSKNSFVRAETYKYHTGYSIVLYHKLASIGSLNNFAQY